MGKMEAVTDFIFLDSKITMDGDCSQEIQSKAMTNLDSIFKSSEFQRIPRRDKKAFLSDQQQNGKDQRSLQEN